MKNILIFLVFFFSFTSQVQAIFIPPFFDINLEIKSEAGDFEFAYNLESYSPENPVPNEDQNFTIQTENGIGNYQTSVVVVDGDSVYLRQDPLADWELVDSICTSSDSRVIALNIDFGVKIIAYPFTSITCNFTITKKEKPPVIIIPGILSSYLNRNDDEKSELWPNAIKALFGWPGDEYLDELSLNEIGQPKNSYPNVLTTDIIRKIGNKDFFNGLIKKLEATGYEEGVNLFVFPYDWRRDIRSIDLKSKIDEILEQTGASRIDVIAHSMGGLLTKYYINQQKGNNKINKFIDIATPHLGAPAAFKTLFSGDDMGIKFGIFGLNSSQVQKISQNMPSLYQLLPSRDYFSTSASDYKYYLYDLDDIDQDGVGGRLDFDQSKQFLKNTGRNHILLDNAPNIHNDLDLMNPADHGVKAYNIVGCGVPTIGKFFTLGQKNNNSEYYDIAYISGDGTVPERSARSFPAAQEFQIAGLNHAILPSSLIVKDLIVDLLEGKEITSTTDSCILPDGDLLSFHGPVQVNIYDQDNNHTGPVLGSGYEHNLPEISYDFINNNTFIFLPSLNEYKVNISATKEGSVNVYHKKMKDEEIRTTFHFKDITLDSASTTLEVNIQGLTPEIILGEKIILPSAVIEGDYLDSLTPSATSTNLVENTNEKEEHEKIEIVDNLEVVINDDNSQEEERELKVHDKPKGRRFKSLVVHDEEKNTQLLTIIPEKETESTLVINNKQDNEKDYSKDLHYASVVSSGFDFKKIFWLILLTPLILPAFIKYKKSKLLK